MPESAEAANEANAKTGTEAESAGAGSEGRKPEDQDMVPRARLNEVLTIQRRLENENAVQQGRLDALQEQVSKGGGEKELTASELRSKIEAEEITQGQADDIIQRQTNERIEKRVDEEVGKRTAQSTSAAKISSEIERYVEAQPDAAVAGSDIHTKVGDEYRYLLGIGHKAEPATQLAALRASLGPVDKMNAAGPGKGERETHQETSGGGDGGGQASPDEKGWPKEMDRDSQRYYEDLVNKGVYPDKTAAIEEFNYKPKHGARH